MSGPAFISERTRRELRIVFEAFGLDWEWNKHLFSFAAKVDGKAFEVVIRALAQAIEQDCRYGINERIRKSIAEEKAKKWALRKIVWEPGK